MSFDPVVGVGTGLLVNTAMPGKPLMSAGAGGAAAYWVGNMTTAPANSTRYAVLGGGVGSLAGRMMMGGGKPWLGAAIGAAAGYYYGTNNA